MNHGPTGEHPSQDKPKQPPPLEELAEAELELSEEEKQAAQQAALERADRDREQAEQDRQLERDARIEAEAARKAENSEKAQKIIEKLHAAKAPQEKSFGEKLDETSDKLDAFAKQAPKEILKVLGKGFLFTGVTIGWVAKHPLGLAARTVEWGLLQLEEFFGQWTPKWVKDGTDKAISWLHKKTGITEEDVKKGKAAHDAGKHGGHAAKEGHGGGGHGGGHAAKEGHGGGGHGGGHAAKEGHGGGHAKKKGGGGHGGGH